MLFQLCEIEDILSAKSSLSGKNLQIYWHNSAGGDIISLQICLPYFCGGMSERSKVPVLKTRISEKVSEVRILLHPNYVFSNLFHSFFRGFNSIGRVSRLQRGG